MRKQRILFESYTGGDPYVFVRYDSADQQTASEIINRLIEKRFRICYAEHNRKTIENTEWVASRILSSKLAVFLVSAESLKSLAYRNVINYALHKKKRLFCVYLEDFELDPGMAMQLTHVPSARQSDFPSVEALCEDIERTEFFVQNMRGDHAKKPIKNNRIKRIAITATAVVLTVFFVAAAVMTVQRINYKNSFSGQIETMAETDYLDISEENASVIELLRGKTVTTLIARKMDLTDITALRYVHCDTLDLSENPDIFTLEPLLYNTGLKTVIVTQDMYPAIAKVGGRNRFRILLSD